MGGEEGKQLVGADPSKCRQVDPVALPLVPLALSHVIRLGTRFDPRKRKGAPSIVYKAPAPVFGNYFLVAMSPPMLTWVYRVDVVCCLAPLATSINAPPLHGRHRKRPAPTPIVERSAKVRRVFAISGTLNLVQISELVLGTKAIAREDSDAPHLSCLFIECSELGKFTI